LHLYGESARFKDWAEQIYGLNVAKAKAAHLWIDVQNH
jgi:hypothetical protein